MLVFECEDRHVICLQCFGIYAKGRLNERQMIADTDLGMEISTYTGFDCYWVFSFGRFDYNGA